MIHPARFQAPIPVPEHPIRCLIRAEWRRKPQAGDVRRARTTITTIATTPTSASQAHIARDAHVALAGSPAAAVALVSDVASSIVTVPGVIGGCQVTVCPLTDPLVVVIVPGSVNRTVRPKPSASC